MQLANIIIRPLVTEKSTRLQHSKNVYAFAVALGANKHQITEAVETLYNVKVLGVRTIVRKGKPKRTRTKEIHKSDTKRALVTLAAESKIELF